MQGRHTAEERFAWGKEARPYFDAKPQAPASAHIDHDNGLPFGLCTCKEGVQLVVAAWHFDQGDGEAFAGEAIPGVFFVAD